MRKKYEGYLFLAILVLLSVVFFYLSAMSWGTLSQSKERILCSLSEPVSENQAALLMKQYLEQLEDNIQADREEESLKFCIWGQKEQVVLRNENLSRSTQADVILFCGSLELLYEDCRRPAWEDEQGCLLDEEAAWALFGSTSVEGKEITFEEERYTVRRVISGKDGIAVVPVGRSKAQNVAPENGVKAEREDTEQILNRVTIKRIESQLVSEQQAAWTNQFGLSVDLLDLEFLRGISGFCVLLVPAVFCGVFLYKLWKLYQKMDLWRWKGMLLVVILLSVVLFLLQFQKWVLIPDDYIPARWSDFAFWSQLGKQKRESIKMLLQIHKSVIDDEWMIPFLSGVLYSFLSQGFAIFSTVAFCHLKKRDGRS